MAQRINYIHQSPELLGSTNAWSRLNIAFKTAPGSSGATFGRDKANLA